MLTIKDSKVDEKSVHQSPKITFHFIAPITSQSHSVSSMVASGYINMHWWIKIIIKEPKYMYKLNKTFSKLHKLKFIWIIRVISLELMVKMELSENLKKYFKLT